jgi:15-cis-phytoene synthase
MNALAKTGKANPAQAAPVQLRTAYGVCRHITRKAARNFYYAFMVLPRRKRDALSAVYAFMRHADDISDDPALPILEKRARLQQWLEALHRVVGGEPTDDPILMAVALSQHRYNIPIELLEKLVYGTAMDCVIPAASGQMPAPDAPTVLYRTFPELYDYCYHVASVVGLVCIKVFGYRDPAAEPLAEKVGVAFQLTNIIRDIKEDAAMGRIYLPQEDLDRFGLGASMFRESTNTATFQPLLAFEAERARQYYAAGRELIPLVDEQCQPALWCLIEIYSQLLEKIASRNFDVFSQRVRLTTSEKLRIVARAMWRRISE